MRSPRGSTSRCPGRRCHIGLIAVCPCGRAAAQRVENGRCGFGITLPTFSLQQTTPIHPSHAGHPPPADTPTAPSPGPPQSSVVPAPAPSPKKSGASFVKILATCVSLPPPPLPRPFDPVGATPRTGTAMSSPRRLASRCGLTAAFLLVALGIGSFFFCVSSAIFDAQPPSPSPNRTRARRRSPHKVLRAPLRRLAHPLLRMRRRKGTARYS